MISLPPPVVSLTTAAATGALTLLRPADWRPAVRRAYVWLPAIGTAAGVLWVTRPGRKANQVGDGSEQVGPGVAPAALPRTDARKLLAARASVSLAVGVVLAAVGTGSLKLDAGIERRLAGRGLRHPRRWMAAAVAVASLGMDAISNASESRGRREQG